MKKWMELSKDEREEWRRSPVTQAAIGHLREREAFARDRLVSGAHTEPLDQIRWRAGELVGIANVIDDLARTEK